MKYIIQIALTSLFLSQNAFGAGFALIEQSVSLMGTAYAGAAASACDASTIYFNPAGMSQLCHQEVVFGAHAVLPSAKFNNQDSFNLFGLITGDNGGDAGENAVVAHLSCVKPLGDRFRFGLTINTPFGLATEYNDTWVGRYHAIRSELLTININPCFSFKLNDCLSIGAGVSAMWIDAELTNAIDLQVFELPLPDIKTKLKGDSWGYGFNVGLLANIGASSRIGVHYRSKVKQNVKGTVDFENVPSIPLLQSIFVHSKARSDVTLPSTFSISGVHDINCRWSVLGDFTWTKWNEVPALVFHFDNENLPTKQVTLKWKNGQRYSLGAIYQYNPCTELRCGFAYDKSPASSPEFTTPRIPDADRYWLTFGLGYQWNECTYLDFGYAHLWATDPKIYQVLNEENLTSGALRGKWKAYTDIISLQVRYLF